MLLCHLSSFFGNFGLFWQCHAAFGIPVPQQGIGPGSVRLDPGLSVPSRPAASSPCSFLRGCVCSNRFPVVRLGSFLIANVPRALRISCVRLLYERRFRRHFLPSKPYPLSPRPYAEKLVTLVKFSLFFSFMGRILSL